MIPQDSQGEQRKKQKKPKEVYKDPIYGIPHFHDPALSRLIRKHDPSYQVAESMRTLYVKSQQRLRTVKANKPKYLHTRFNIDTLRTSPLMCMPHFEDMTDFLARWFESRDKRKSAAVTTTQQATFVAQEKFCTALFLLLQETARATPLTPAPLKGIYNWYLQRDSVINQSRTIDRNPGDDAFYVIELTNGKKIKVPKSIFDPNVVFDQSIFDPDRMQEEMRNIKPEPKPSENDGNKRAGAHRPDIITSTSMTKPPKKQPNAHSVMPTFNYDEFHAQMVEQRQSERDTDLIANFYKEKRRKEISRREGWQ